MAGDQISLIWADAVSQYYKTTGINLHDARSPKPRSAEDLLEQVDRQQATFAEFRNKRAKIFKVLSGTLTPVELLGNLAAGGASMAFPPSSLVFGAVTYLIDVRISLHPASPALAYWAQLTLGNGPKAAHGVSAAYDAIIALFSTMKEFTCRLSVHLQQEISPELQKIVTEIFVALMSICAMSTKYIKEGRVLKYLKVFSLGRDSAVQGALARLQTLTENEEKMVGALTLSQASKTGKVVDNVHLTVVDMNASLKDMSASWKDMHEQLSSLVSAGKEAGHEGEKRTDADMLQKLKRDLCPDRSVQDDLDAASNSRVSGTGEWVTTEPLFQAWLQRSKALLWVSGGPGAGKSYLSASIVRLLQGLYPQGAKNMSRVSIAYFFCRDFNPDRRSFDKILRTLAYQIAENDPLYLRHAIRVCEDLDDLRTLPGIWRRLFLDFFNAEGSKSSVYIIVDGLDEAYQKDREEFLQLLRAAELNQEGDGAPAMQTLLVGRLDLNKNIEEIMERQVPMIEVSARKNSEDIDNYIASSIKKSVTLRKVSEALRQEIITKLREGADGMFLWVNLMITEIATKRRPDSIRQALNQMPKGLSAMIFHVLERLSSTLEPEAIEDLNKLLSWVTCAARPLTLGELDLAVTLQSVSQDGFINLEDDLRNQYASLFTMVREDGKTTEDLQTGARRDEVAFADEMFNDGQGPTEAGATSVQDGAEEKAEDDEITSDPDTTIVRLGHASLGDYLRREQDQHGVAVGINVNRSELAIAKTCMALLCDGPMFMKSRSSSLAAYAASFWQHHLRRVDLSKVTAEDKQEVVRLLLKLFREPESVKRWVVPGPIHDTWLYENEATDCVQRWLSDEAVLDLLDPEVRAWSPATGTRFTEELFKPVAMVLARQWLQGGGYSLMCYTFIDAYLRKIEGLLDKTQLQSASSSAKPVDVDRIITVAQWAQLEKDAMWYAKVGVVLRLTGNINSAIEFGTKAIEKDDKLAVAYTDLARSYDLGLRHETSIQYALKSQELSTAEEDRDRYIMNAYEIARRYQVLGRVDAAVAYLGGEMKERRLDVQCSKLQIRLLLESGKYAEAFALLRQLEAEELAGEGGYSTLVQCFHDDEDDNGVDMSDYVTHQSLRRAAQTVHETAYLNHCYELAILAAKQKGEVGLWARMRTCHGQFLWELNLDLPRAIRIWEQIVHHAAVANKHDTALAKARRLASEELSMVEFSQALAAHRAGTDCAPFVAAMERLAAEPGATTTTRAYPSPALDDPYGSDNAALVLAAFYRIQGRPEEARARLRSKVIRALDILTDDDEENDADGFAQLSHTLYRFGDDVNAAAAWHLCCMAVAAVFGRRQHVAAGTTTTTTTDEGGADAEKTSDDAHLATIAHLHLSDAAARDHNDPDPPSSAPDRAPAPAPVEAIEYGKAEWEQLVRFSAFGTCDGPCGIKLGPDSGNHWCRYCADYAFCDACFRRLQTGQIPYRLCDGGHDFFTRTWPRRRLPPGMVCVGDDQVRPMAEWLADLRTAWTVAG
ncbi:MAG: hypothetical protein M1826_005778 [Phylliscum demangeonii]|nr:MAG: hypothetical protein M1826_005778 [Phylliscum demangeonii]